METVPEFRILVVDDEKSNLMVLNRILSPEYTVFTAKSGKEGPERAVAEQPDLILLDIVMPDLNGFDVLTTLKKTSETMKIPVIIITGLSGEIDEEKGFLLGAVDYITKPFKNPIVLARVRTHIQIVRQIRTIEQLGLIDGLTNVSNRRCFDDRMELEWRRAKREKKPIAFLMMDVDKFKIYNDTYGHPQGGVLLKSIVKIFSAAAMRTTDLVARLGARNSAYSSRTQILAPPWLLRRRSAPEWKLSASPRRTARPSPPQPSVSVRCPWSRTTKLRCRSFSP
jgi:PleD family two-component response regulator